MSAASWVVESDGAGIPPGAAVQFAVHFTRYGKFDGNFGPFETEREAEFFLYASRNGGKPDRVAKVVRVYRAAISRATGGAGPTT